jgi:hypothetical protein
MGSLPVTLLPSMTCTVALPVVARGTGTASPALVHVLALVLLAAGNIQSEHRKQAGTRPNDGAARITLAPSSADPRYAQWNPTQVPDAQSPSTTHCAPASPS